MSAIFGIVRFDGADANPRELERMGTVLAHRGPDGRKFVTSGAIGLGHCLMRVNEEDRFEVQPLIDRDAGLTLVADCRIDNRAELAAAFRLAAADTAAMPDSAFILAAYKRWGEDCAEHLVGDFAFALWDARATTLLLARDHMGMRALHYHRGKDFLAFATETKALWAVDGVPREISQAQLAKRFLLALERGDGATLFEGIAGLTGGTRLVIRADGQASRKVYWQPHADPSHLGRDEAYYLENFRSILTEAVACRIRRLTGRPALLLSAGFDSGAIAGLSGPILDAKGMKLTTISSVVREGQGDRFRCPRKWVEACRRVMPHLDVHYHIARDAPLFTDNERYIASADGIAHGMLHAQHAMLQAARARGARVVMDGFGGDSTLNPRGWDTLADLLRAGQFRRVWSELRKGRGGRTAWTMLRHEIAGEFAPYWLRRAFKIVQRGAAWRNRLVAPAFARQAMASGVEPSEGVWREKGVALSAAMLRHVAGQARQPTVLEAASHGLDLTRPLRDKRVVEFGLAIPRELQVDNGFNRSLARRALADVYPPEFQTRGWLQDFAIPDMQGIFHDALPLLRTEIAHLADDPAMSRYFDYEAMRKFLDEQSDDRPADSRMVSVLQAVAAGRYLRWFQGRNA